MTSSFNLHSCVHPPRHLRNVTTHHHSINCSACECPISSGNAFNCSACESNLHLICRNRYPFLSSEMHPAHILSFHHFNPTRPTTCDVCDESIRGVSYTCYPCDFDVHPECSQLPLPVPSTVNGGLGNHPLLLSSDIHPAHTLVFHHFEPTRAAFCDVCNNSIRGVSYTCYPCDFDVHPECSQLPLHVPGDNLVDHHQTSRTYGSGSGSGSGSGPCYHNNGGGGGNGFDNASDVGRRSGGSSMGRFLGGVVTSIAKHELGHILSDIFFD